MILAPADLRQITRSQITAILSPSKLKEQEGEVTPSNVDHHHLFEFEQVEMEYPWLDPISEPAIIWCRFASLPYQCLKGLDLTLPLPLPSTSISLRGLLRLLLRVCLKSYENLPKEPFHTRLSLDQIPAYLAWDLHQILNSNT